MPCSTFQEIIVDRPAVDVLNRLMPWEATNETLSTTPVAPKAADSSDQHPAGVDPPGAVIYGEDQARAIIVHITGYYAAPMGSQKECVLDGDFSIEELEALVWWIKNKPGVQFPDV